MKLLSSLFSSFFSVVTLASVVACSSTPAGDDKGNDKNGDKAADNSDTAPAANCEARCKAVATTCHFPSDQCATECASLSETQIKCMEGAGCDVETIKQCAQPPKADPKPQDPGQSVCLDKDHRPDPKLKKFDCQCNGVLKMINVCEESAALACQTWCGKDCTAASKCTPK